MKKIIFILFFTLLCPIFVFAVDRVDINTATLSQLDEIVHVGPKTAQKIIAGRPYSSVNDLSRAKGIGNGKYLQDIIDQGWACVNCQTEIAQTQQTAQEVDQTPSPTPAPSTTPTPTPTPAITYPSGVFINEILPNPSGADETNEWIELYNSNSSDVDLPGWQIQDTEGTTTTYTIPKNTKILANGFLIFKRPDTKIMLNNDEDGLNILTPDKKIVDSVVFTKAPLGQSYNKTKSGWAWSTTLTPGAVNIVTTPASKNSTKNLSKPKNSGNNNDVGVGLADLSQTTNVNQDNNKITNPWFLFFVALAITIILASIVLLIKFRVYKK